MKTRNPPKKQKQSTWATFRAVLWTSLVTFGAKLIAELIIAAISVHVAVDQMPQVILV